MKHSVLALLLLAFGCDSTLPTEPTSNIASTYVAVDAVGSKRPSNVQYEFTILGTLGGTYSNAYAINAAGAVVGYSEILPGTYRLHAFLWEDGQMMDLGTLGGAWSSAFDISDNGAVVGESELGPGQPYHAYMWRQGDMEDLGTLGGDYSSAKAVNERGDAAGFSLTDSGLPHATLWTNRGVVDLGTLGGDYSYAEGINARGWVVGYSTTNGTSTDHAFLWRNGVMTDLGTLGGNESQATDINDAGDVTGYSTTADGFGHAFLWRKGTMTDLGPAVDNRFSQGLSVANGGYVAGICNAFAFPSQHACIWTNGDVVDLPDVSWSNANGMNQGGDVVGYGGNGWPYRALLWRRER